VPSGTPSDLLTGLSAPWSLATLPDGTTLLSERDSAQVLEMTGGGATRIVGTVHSVVPSGEGGLLGLAAHPEPCGGTGSTPSCLFLYAYVTSASDNRIVRMPLRGGPGSYSLGAGQTILAGIAKAGNHDGGRMAFGPDGNLYATTGDAGNGANAQSLGSLNGKILRLAPDGSVPADNPFPGSPVYTLGHRNPQGIAWDSSGRMWASEFGQNTWDELNLIRPGKNYGWPAVEGIAAQPAFTDPVYQWATSAASPSGIAIAGTTIFMASLRGERLWVITPNADGTSATAAAYLQGRLGRLRDVQVHGNALWILTNNTDGRGTPRPGDDRLVSVPLDPP
jgi:glucose/arabinose dehydrogenase